MTKEAEVHGEINNDVTVLTSDVEVERGPYKSGKKAVRINKHLPDSVDLSCIPEDCPEHIKRGCVLNIFDLVDNTWRAGRTIKINKAKRHVLVHFIGYNKRYDEWLPYNSPRLRASQSAERPLPAHDSDSSSSSGVVDEERVTSEPSDSTLDNEHTYNRSGQDNHAPSSAAGEGGVSMGGLDPPSDPLLCASLVDMPVAVAVAPSPSQRPRRGGEGEKAKNSLFTPDSNYRKPKLKQHDGGDISSGESTPPDIPSRPPKHAAGIPKAPTWRAMKAVLASRDTAFTLDNGENGYDSISSPANPAQLHRDRSQAPAAFVSEHRAEGVVIPNGHHRTEPTAHAVKAEPDTVTTQCDARDSVDVSQPQGEHAHPQVPPSGTAVQCKKERDRRKLTPPATAVDVTQGRPKRCGLGELARTSLFINHPALPELDESGKVIARPKRSGEGEAAKNVLFTNSSVSSAHGPAKSAAASGKAASSSHRVHLPPKSPARPTSADSQKAARGTSPQQSSAKRTVPPIDAPAIKKEPVHYKKRVVVPLPPRSLPKRGELGEGAKNSLFTNPPPRYEPAITLDTVKSGAVDVEAVINNQQIGDAVPAQPKVLEATPADVAPPNAISAEEAALRQSQLEKGQGVYAKWDEDNIYYPARVAHVLADEMYTVVFDDGVERSLPRGLIIAVVPKHHQRPKKQPAPKVVEKEKKTEVMAEPEPQNDDSDADSIIECICGTHADCGRMIQCDHCETWHHNECVGVGAQDIPSRFSCHGCKRFVYAKTPKEVFMGHKYPTLLRQAPSGQHKDAMRLGERLRYAHLLLNDQLYALRKAMSGSALKLAELAEQEALTCQQANCASDQGTQPQAQPQVQPVAQGETDAIAAEQRSFENPMPCTIPTTAADGAAGGQETANREDEGDMQPFRRKRRLYEELDNEYTEMEKRLRVLESQLDELSGSRF